MKFPIYVEKKKRWWRKHAHTYMNAYGHTDLSLRSFVRWETNNEFSIFLTNKRDIIGNQHRFSTWFWLIKIIYASVFRSLLPLSPSRSLALSLWVIFIYEVHRFQTRNNEETETTREKKFNEFEFVETRFLSDESF